MERLVQAPSSLVLQEPRGSQCLQWVLRGWAVPRSGRRMRSLLRGRAGLRSPVRVPARGSCHRSRSWAGAAQLQSSVPAPAG